MPAFVLTNVQLLLGSTELGPFSGGFESMAETQMQEANHFAALGYTVVLPGITTATGMISGHSDYAVGAVSDVFDSTAIGDQFAFSALPFGSATVAGDPAIFMRGILNKIAALTGSVGSVADFSMDIAGDSAHVDGQVAMPLASRGALTGTSVQMGAVTATRRLWAALHVTGGTFTNLAVTIGSDNAVGFPSSTTQITFATVSVPGWQFLSVAGPITDDYFRAVSTIGSGTATYAVVFGIA